MTNPSHSLKLVSESNEPGPDGKELKDQVGPSEVVEADAIDDESSSGAAEPETTEESEVDAAETEPAGTRWSRLRARLARRALATGAGVAVLIAALAVAGVLGWKLRTEREVAAAGQQALAAAQQYAVILTSVDASKLDQNFDAVLDGATGQFKDMYGQSSGQLKQLLIDNKAKAEGKVIAAGIKSATEDKVEVLLFLDQSVTNSVNPQPRLDRNRIIMTMELVNGRWLASDVELP
ncbi:MAG: hypothetical protein WCE30_04050 [Mycobacterium sp.]